jgi:hypothetical protein
MGAQMNEQPNEVFGASEAMAEIAALRCALHALAHTIATSAGSADDAVRHFDNLARQWNGSLTRIDGNQNRGFQAHAAGIRRQILAAGMRQKQA